MKIRCFAFTPRQAVAAAASVVASLLLMHSPSADAQRLSKTVVPEHYTLSLTPDLKAATFTGVETIDVDLKEAANSITLNSAEIEFQSVTISAGGSKQTATVSSDKDKEQTTFTVPNQIAAGKAKIVIHYSGILNGKLRGFYLS